MNTKRQIKKQLEELYTEESNSTCFDCDSKPAHWASISNGIFLCLDCSGEHRGYGIGVSFIRSVTMDQWTQEQVNIMKAGGNQRLRDFLTTYEMPENIDKKQIYCSKLMHYYRKQLKAESIGQIFMEPLPPKEEFWAQLNSDEETSSLFNNNNNNSINQINNLPKNDIFYSNKFEEDAKMPKNEIIISEDQYQKARNQAEISSTFSNPIPTEPKFNSFSSDKNDDRYSSVGSEKNNSNSYFNSASYSSWFPDSGYFGTVRNILGTVWGTGVTVASGVKDKMNEYEVGSKLLYVGGKTFEGIGYVGGKIIEKGGDIIRSDTVKNIAYKTGEGLWYLKDRIMGSNNSSSNNYKNKDDDSFLGGGNYSSTGSDDYKSY
jgi:hypothetical protein